MGRVLDFRSVEFGDGTGGAWADRSRLVWPEIVGLAADDLDEATAVELFERHMPELVPVLERLAVELDRPGGRALLTHTGIRPVLSGCTQAGVAGALVRNYDFDTAMCERTVASSCFLRPVIGMNELLWGLLDGMNDAGLAVSLTFGGSFDNGRGFHILLVVRYLLETCATVDEAWEKLVALPVSTSQNLTLVDAHQAMTVHLGPGRPAVRSSEACATNHQDRPVPAEQEAATATQLRYATVRAATRNAAAAPDPAEAVLAELLRPPLYNDDYDHGLGTLYTAGYRPAEGRVSYLWPDARREQSFSDFTEDSWSVMVG